MIKILSTKKSWIEGIAIQQLEKVAKLDGVNNVIGLPDLHSGPVGMAMASEKFIYPHLVGNDVGCGLGLWQTNTHIRKGKRDKWAKKLINLDMPYEYDENSIEQFISPFGINSERWLTALGTIGGGNHFAELQQIDTIYNKELFEENKMKKENFYLLVHSGSRALGKFIMDSHIEKNGSIGLLDDSDEGQEYLEKHNYAVKWGRANRNLIAHRFLNSLKIDASLICDITHNSVTQEQFEDGKLWVHRKGASPNNKGIAVIAGSRGSLSYLVKPTGDLVSSNFSIAHGAGRKLKRSEMENRLRDKQSAQSLTQTSFGSIVICDDKKLLYEEAPEAYKNIEQVIEDLKHYGLIEVIASLKPYITYKTRGSKWK